MEKKKQNSKPYILKDGWGYLKIRFKNKVYELGKAFLSDINCYSWCFGGKRKNWKYNLEKYFRAWLFWGGFFGKSKIQKTFWKKML